MKEEPKFAVIGAGNVGKAMAAHLSLLGYRVNLFNRTEENILPFKKDNKISVCGIIEGCTKINHITSDIHRAIEDVDIIMVTIPASGHKKIADLIGPNLLENQKIVLNPGRTLGALEFSHRLRKYDKTNIVAETQTILYTTRFCDMKSEIFAIKRKVPLAAFPACRTGEILDVFKDIYPEFTRAKDSLETGLANVGAILHPTPTLLNVGWIESGKTPFKYYYEGITPSISQYLESLDHERISIAHTLGYNIPSVKEWLHEAYGITGRSLYETLQNNEAYQKIDAPQKIKHRYIYEDIPTGLVPISSIGQKMLISTPNINAVVELASSITGSNFRQCGRTLDSCGLAGMTLESLVDYVYYGEEAYKS
ncbi:MAG: NAD/NADP octopine/nopaline dehydrogenase family protein [Methanoculleus sp.]|jgi:opine dehydrogenase